MTRLHEALARKVKSHTGDLPRVVKEGLHPRITLRDYQKRAVVASQLTFDDPDLLLDDAQALAFHLATGAGKTVVLAANINQLAAAGFRRFVFVVNATALIDKTRSSLCDPQHPKFLLNPRGILLDGRRHELVEVDQFSEDTPTGVLEVVFTTIQQLHKDITEPREGRPTEANLTAAPTIFLIDEAHHINAATRRHPGQLALEATWEDTVERLFTNVPDGWLLEYSATLDVEPSMVDKYERRTVSRYTLREFREDGWSKDVLLLKAGGEDVERALLACALSEYRRHVAASAGIACKPVVMFKHNSIKALTAFHRDLMARLDELSGGDLLRLAARHGSASPLREAFAALCPDVDTAARFAEQLRISFHPDTCWIGHSEKETTPEEMAQVNSLEDPTNPIRAVFVVAKLTEGWDVLNLFDIVRLGEVAKGAKALGKSCVSDAQLLGRGARYWPFPKQVGQPTDRRVFDMDLDNPLRLLEQVHYHSVSDNRLISELQKALRATGLVGDDFDEVEVDVTVKPAFRNTRAFASGVIFQNEVEEVPEAASTMRDLGLPSLRAGVHLDGAAVLGVDSEIPDDVPVTAGVRLSDLDRSLLRTAARRGGVTYELVAKATTAPGLSEFLFSDKWLGSVELKLTLTGGGAADLTPDGWLLTVSSSMERVAAHLRAAGTRQRGSKVFRPVPLHEVVTDKKMRLRRGGQPTGNGVPMTVEPDDRLRLNLREQDWFAHEDNHGTDQEKLLIRWFAANRERIFGDRFTEQYLIRNAGYFALYDFDAGRRCEPDFLILLLGHGDEAVGGVQVFVESKGPHLRAADAWKQAFLTRIAGEVELLADEDTWRLHGLPFFTDDPRDSSTLGEFETSAARVPVAG